MKPLIGITPKAIGPNSQLKPGSFCETAYAEAVSLAGGIPIILHPTTSKITLRAYLGCCHGLLLSGGGDVAESFHKKPLTTQERSSLTGVDSIRDEMEVYLVRHAVAANLPVLGICRGAQVMNIAFGGTLLPDIPNHKNVNPKALAHKIQWLQNGILMKALRGYGRVNTSHHQSIDKPAEGFRVVAKAPDGIVEAIEMSGRDFVCGVQFHPERLVHITPQFLHLFKTFVAHAKKRA